MTFMEAEEYINRIPRFADSHTLKDSRSYLDTLGSPDDGMKIIHVAGTNGKGSVCNYLTEILIDAGYHVGTFISPHLVTIRERMSVDGEMISEDDFARYCGIVREKLANKYAFPADSFPNCTYMEFLFHMAMIWFRDKGVDWVVLETGLGGRLDVTNCVRSKKMTVITRIGMDHMQYLGNTIAAIAGEKAGIIRNGTPVVTLTEPAEAYDVICMRAKETGAPVFAVDRNNYKSSYDSGKSIDFSFYNRYDLAEIHCTLNTVAAYQIENCALAVCAASLLRGDDGQKSVTNDNICRGISKAFWPARMEEIAPGVFIDGGHNADGIDAFIESVSKITLPEGGKRYLLFSAVKDKQYGIMMDRLVLSGLFSGIAMAPMSDTPRSLGPGELRSIASDHDSTCFEVYRSAEEALQKLIAAKQKSDLVFAAGSLYLAGEIKAAVLKNDAAT